MSLSSLLLFLIMSSHMEPMCIHSTFTATLTGTSPTSESTPSWGSLASMLQNILLSSNSGAPLTHADFQIFATRVGTAVAEACCEAGYCELPDALKAQMTHSFMDSFSTLPSWHSCSFCHSDLTPVHRDYCTPVLLFMLLYHLPFDDDDPKHNTGCFGRFRD